MIVFLLKGFNRLDAHCIQRFFNRDYDQSVEGIDEEEVQFDKINSL